MTASDFTAPVTWDDVTSASGGHFFDDDTMEFFSARLNGSPRVIDGRAYGVVSSKPPHADRHYEIVRVVHGGVTERAHDPDDPHAPDARELRFSDRDEALRTLDTLTDPSEFTWY